MIAAQTTTNGPIELNVRGWIKQQQQMAGLSLKNNGPIESNVQLTCK